MPDVLRGTLALDVAADDEVTRMAHVSSPSTAGDLTGMPDDGMCWIHIDRTASGAAQWIREKSGIDPVAAEALLAEDTRPREARSGDGLLVILRGVNLNPGAEPDDMLSLRMWVDARRLVSLRHYRFLAVRDVRELLDQGHGPASPGDLLVDLAERLGERMSDVLDSLSDRLDVLEDQVITHESHAIRPKLARVRREAIALRRYLAPQRDVLARLQNERVEWLSDLDRVRLREAADRMTRYVEDLDAMRDRAAVTQDELNNRLSERMNRTMYVLSLVAAIFLPLGLMTGLLGINVGGIPWADDPAGFAAVTGLLVLIAVGLVSLFRWMRWL
jgi:zinc transporter